MSEKKETLKAPFPWFGGKSKVAGLVWARFGDDRYSYVEPFFGSGAVLLGRPEATNDTNRYETVNDLDGFVANFWRALKSDPDKVASFADNPVFENDLHARHAWLTVQRQDLVARLEGDPDFFDAKIAGWWVWGQCSWIGRGWCSGKGPWHAVDGRLIREPDHAGIGVNRQRPHLGDAGSGVNRQRPHLGNAGSGVNRTGAALMDWMQALAVRLRRVRVVCGDWRRVTGDAVLFAGTKSSCVFLDPPYADTAKRDKDLYSMDSTSVAHEVRAWAIENGERPDVRIALCGYEGEHAMPESWECVAWKAHGGYSTRNKDNTNKTKERIWFSPACLKPKTEQVKPETDKDQGEMFVDGGE